ncbi:serine/threonine-protein phosphatase 4 regulatory subunit 2-B-like [Oppia nitens]|uniref:serine/threonine-protein phosphatase 4 regulatory subunit 2-B-like n=1 Tax=Oppia nitens TaxID=1686743 RepID=UPI0023DB3D49|nr:serine/threonine-protein phosphatase 4 regulatory subunit 2-B-like [Oppia nitens]
MTKTADLNRELILDELSNFEKKRNGDIPDILNKYLENVAQNGDTVFSWTKLQPLLRRKLEIVMNEFHQMCPTDHLMPLPNVKPFDFDELKNQILESIDTFGSAPFTIQRICELLTNPSKHYKRTDKFMRGIEKNILVVSTIEPNSTNGNEENEFHSPSSFKNLFTALHSTSYSTNTSLTTASTSMLVNGVNDVLCDNQLNLMQSSNESTLQPLSGPVSPTSLPLSPNTTSPPNQHLPPLQQLDSFTNVFASSSPSNPLSVVSDLHSYEQSSSLYQPMTSNDKCLLSSTNIKSSDEYKITCNQDLDSTITTTTSSSLQNNTLTDISNDVKSNDNIIQNDSNHETNETKKFKPNESIDSLKVNEEVSHSNSQEENKEVINTNLNNEIKCDENTTVIEDKLIKSTDNSVDTNNRTNIQSNEDIGSETITESCSSSSDICIQSDENKTPVDKELINESHSSETFDNNDNISEEDTSQPMDFCGSNNGNSDQNNTDITDLSDKNSDNNSMDETLTSSDLSEPMDED